MYATCLTVNGDCFLKVRYKLSELTLVGMDISRVVIFFLTFYT